MRGVNIFEGLFPGLKADLVAQGAQPLNLGTEGRYFLEGGWVPHCESEMELYPSTRALLEATIRQKIVALPQLEVIEGVDVLGLTTSEDRKFVQGVSFCRRNQEGKDRTAEILEADLVVDASGRNSRAPQWLRNLGCTAPEETVVDADWSYASRLIALPAERTEDWRMFYIFSQAPHSPASAIITPVEGGRFHVTLAGSMGICPPTEEADFLEFARRLPSSELYEVLREATPLSPVQGYRGGSNRLRHYECLTDMPEGFLVMGDAYCAVNFVYGQGMTLCALEAQELDRCLQARSRGAVRQGIVGLGRRFHGRLRRVIASGWRMATMEDRRWTSAQDGQLDMQTRCMHWYLDHFKALMRVSPVHFQVFLRAQNMIGSPYQILHPKVLFPVLVHALRSLCRRKEQEPAPSDGGRNTQRDMEVEISKLAESLRHPA